MLIHKILAMIKTRHVKTKSRHVMIETLSGNNVFHLRGGKPIRLNSEGEEEDYPWMRCVMMPYGDPSYEIEYLIKDGKVQ